MKRIRLGGALLILVLSCAIIAPADASIGDWVIEGDKVYVDDNEVYLSASPHTIGSSGWVEFEVRSKKYEGDIDAVWGFTENVTPKLPQIWSQDVEHTLYRWLEIEKAVTWGITGIISYTKLDWATFEGEPDIGNTNNTHLYKINADFDGMGGNSTLVVAFTSFTFNGNSGSVTYNYSAQEQESYIEIYPDWRPLGLDFTKVNKSLLGMDKFYYTQGATIQKDVTYKVRCWVEVPFAGLKRVTGKYVWGVKPSHLSLQQAKDNGSLYLLDPWYDTQWLYRKKLTIDNTASSENLTNFPVLVHLDDTNIDWSLIQNAGQDVRFTDSDGETLLNYQIETWDDNNTANIFAKGPQFDASSDNDSVYIYYGNPLAADGQTVEGVFDDTVMVGSYNGATSILLNDISGGGNDGDFKGVGEPAWSTNASLNSLQTTDFDGTDDHISLPAGVFQSFDDNDDFSIMSWFYVDGTITGTRTVIALLENTNNRPQIAIVQSGSTDKLLTLVRQSADVTSNLVSSAAIPVVGWHYAVLRYDASDNNKVYLDLDGVAEGNDNADALTFAATDFNEGNIGRFKTASNYFKDKTALSRVYNKFLSADWIEATYLSETDAFLTFGTEEGCPAVPVPFTATISGNNVELAWVLGTRADNTTILRGELQYPVSLTDGIVLYSENGTIYTDTGYGSEITTYYYSAFSWNEEYGFTPLYSTAQAGGANVEELAAQVGLMVTQAGEMVTQVGTFNTEAGAFNSQVGLIIGFFVCLVLLVIGFKIPALMLVGGLGLAVWGFSYWETSQGISIAVVVAGIFAVMFSFSKRSRA